MCLTMLGAGSLNAGAASGRRQSRGDRQSHGVLNRNVERLNAIAGQVDGVAAEGIAHGKIHGYPVLAPMRQQHRRHILASDETDRMHIRESSADDALQIALLATARRQQADHVAKSAVERLHEWDSA